MLAVTGRGRHRCLRRADAGARVRCGANRIDRLARAAGGIIAMVALAVATAAAADGPTPASPSAAAMPPVAEGAASPASDAAFLAAKAAYDRGDYARLDAVATDLATHPLALYVRFWQLDSRIDTAGDDAIRDYLARYRGTPPADLLHADWLKSLAQRGEWDAFAAAWPPPGEPDVELRCDDIQ